MAEIVDLAHYRRTKQEIAEAERQARLLAGVEVLHSGNIQLTITAYSGVTFANNAGLCDTPR